MWLKMKLNKIYSFAVEEFLWNEGLREGVEFEIIEAGESNENYYVSAHFFRHIVDKQFCNIYWWNSEWKFKITEILMK